MTDKEMQLQALNYLIEECDKRLVHLLRQKDYLTQDIERIKLDLEKQNFNILTEKNKKQCLLKLKEIL